MQHRVLLPVSLHHVYTATYTAMHAHTHIRFQWHAPCELLLLFGVTWVEILHKLVCSCICLVRWITWSPGEGLWREEARIERAQTLDVCFFTLLPLPHDGLWTGHLDPLLVRVC